MTKYFKKNKRLKNNKKSKEIHGTSKGRIGLPLNIKDKDNLILSVGDNIKLHEYIGILLYNYHCNKYGIALEDSQWYGDDKYSIDSYGKFIEIPMDNGARMEITKIK